MFRELPRVLWEAEVDKSEEGGQLEVGGSPLK